MILDKDTVSEIGAALSTASAELEKLFPNQCGMYVSAHRDGLSVLYWDGSTHTNIGASSLDELKEKVAATASPEARAAALQHKAEAMIAEARTLLEKANSTAELVTT